MWNRLSSSVSTPSRWFVLLLLLVAQVPAVSSQSFSSSIQQTLQDLFDPETETTVTLLILRLSLVVGLGWMFQQALKKKKQTPRGMPILLHPPQGRSWPFLGQALNFTRYRPWDLMTEWHRQYGPIVCFPLLGATYFTIGSPDLLKQVLQSKIASVKKDVVNSMKPFLVILGTGIVTSEDDSWMRQRLKMSHPLRRDVLDMIPHQTLVSVQRLFEQMDAASESGAVVEVGSSLRHLTLQVISGVFLSLTAQESDSRFAGLYLPIVDESNVRVWHPYREYLFFMPFWWKHHYRVYQLNAYVSGLIRKRWELRQTERNSKDESLWKRQEDILDRVLAVYESKMGLSSSSSLPEEDVRQLRDEMKTFMLAGHETSAAMMTWALYELLHSKDGPEMLDHLRTEARGVFSRNDWRTATPDQIPSFEQLSKLTYSQACLQESLRKYSVVPCVARRTVKDLELDQGKYLLPQGSSIIVNIQAVHMDPTIWPDPTRFDPARFEHKVPEPFTFLPFIAGPRNCLGQHLALLESKMVLSWLADRYEFTLCNDSSAKESSADPRHRYMVPVIPQTEFTVRVKRRFVPQSPVRNGNGKQ